MPHQCIHCSRIIEAGSHEILEGCSICGGKFFFYVRDEDMARLKEKKSNEAVKTIELNPIEKKQVEKEIRDILNIEDEAEPVILDLESVKVLGPGKFEIDLVRLMNKKPIVFKLEEGKYVIDLESGFDRKN
ncbi:MAG: Zn-ribbon domain-containing protein [Nanoarchaeota archaeon]